MKRVGTQLLGSKITVVIVVIFSSLCFMTPVHAASQNLPMTIRAANSSETTLLDSIILPTVLPQTGSSVNAGFTETQQGNVHVGRAWAAEVTPNLASCDTNITISITGNHSLTHVANSVSSLPNPSDQPEAGALLLANSGTSYGSVAGNTDLAVGATLSVISSSSVAATVPAVNSGIKVLVYAETRDDVSQNGAQASFTYTGIPQLQITYDDSACPVAVAAPVVPGVPNTGVKPGRSNGWWVALTSPIVLIGGIVILRKRYISSK